MIYGQDWSSYQPAAPDCTGLDFAFIKATEGTSYVNPEQASQAATARAAGLVVGFYHYITAGDMSAQAQYFVEQCDSVAGDILAADWEQSGVTCADKDAFLRAVQQLRPTHRVVLYCNTYYWTQVDTTSFCADGLWIADYTTPGEPRIQAAWKFQQYTSTPIDKDVANFADRAALRSWAAALEPAANPPPKTGAPDMPQWIPGPIAPGASRTTVVPIPQGSAWSAYPHRALHVFMDDYPSGAGVGAASASVRAAVFSPSGATAETLTVHNDGRGARLQIDGASSVSLVALNAAGPMSLSFAIEVY